MPAEPASPSWSAYDGVQEEVEFADLIAAAPPQSSGGDPLSKTLRRAAKKVAMISRGAQGVVYSAYLRTNDGTPDRRELVAIKRLFSNDGNSCYGAQSNLICAQREVALLQAFANDSHRFPHMVRLLDILQAPSREQCVVLEHCPFTLSSAIIRSAKRKRDGSEAWPDSVSPTHVAFLLREVLVSIKELHDAGIVHRDIKSSNFLIQSDGAIRLADFGSARYEDVRREGGNDPSVTAGNATPAALRTTLVYRSPEGLLGPIPVHHLRAQDIWGAGIIFAEMLRGKHLFTAHGELSMISAVFSLIGTPTEDSWPSFFATPVAQSFQFQPSPSVLREKFEPCATTEGLDLLQRMLCGNPSCRITVDEALGHPFFLLSTLDSAWSEAATSWCAVVKTAVGKHQGTSSLRESAAQRMMQQLMFGCVDDDGASGTSEDDGEGDAFGGF